MSAEDSTRATADTSLTTRTSAEEAARSTAVSSIATVTTSLAARITYGTGAPGTLATGDVYFKVEA